MRTLGPVIIGFLILIGLTMGVDRYITNSSQELVYQLDKVAIALNDKQWDSVKAHLLDMENRWAATQKRWSIFLNHQEIENIDESLSRLKQYVEHEGLVETAGELSTLRKFVDHIVDSETFSFANIL